MGAVDPVAVRQVLEAVVLAFSLLAGTMACFSGLKAAQALLDEAPSHVVGEAVNDGIGRGFMWGAPGATLALIIAMWS